MSNICSVTEEINYYRYKWADLLERIQVTKLAYMSHHRAKKKPWKSQEEVREEVNTGYL